MKSLDRQPTFYLQQAKCRFKPDGNLCLTATIVSHCQQKTKTAQFEILFQFQQQGAEIKFIGGKYLRDRPLDWNDTAAIMSTVSDLLYLRHVANKDLDIVITSIQIKEQQLILTSDTRVKKLLDFVTPALKSITAEI
ncbi:MAG: hypothetical protein AAFQ41_10820, partial [Cyanobacteria bacterium J06623_7]